MVKETVVKLNLIRKNLAVDLFTYNLVEKICLHPMVWKGFAPVEIDEESLSVGIPEFNFQTRLFFEKQAELPQKNISLTSDDDQSQQYLQKVIKYLDSAAILLGDEDTPIPLSIELARSHLFNPELPLHHGFKILQTKIEDLEVNDCHLSDEFIEYFTRTQFRNEWDFFGYSVELRFISIKNLIADVNLCVKEHLDWNREKMEFPEPQVSLWFEF